MKWKNTLGIVALFAGFSFIFPSVGMSGSQQSQSQIIKPPATQQKEIKPGQTPKKVVKLYKIGIEKFELTNKCQLKLVLKNKGADLNADEHKNSTLTVGRNQTLSLSVVDPSGHLKKKGGTISCREAKPLVKETNITAVVTLFNGTKTTKQKLFNPTCPTIKRKMSKTTIQKPKKEMDKKIISPKRDKSLPAVKKLDTLKIKNAYVKDNKIQVVLQHSGRGKLSVKDLTNVKIEIRHGAKTEMVSLKNKRALLQRLSTPGSKINLNTGIELKKKELVSAGLEGMKDLSAWRGQLDPNTKKIPNNMIAKTKPNVPPDFEKPIRKKNKNGLIPSEKAVIKITEKEDSSSSLMLPNGGVKYLTATKLYVKQGGGDFTEWKNSWTDTTPVSISFRWISKLTNIGNARWELDQAPHFPNPASGDVGKVPTKEHFGFFSIDFTEIVNETSEMPMTFYLRVIPAVNEDNQTETVQLLPSNLVTVKFTEAGPITQFQEPIITSIMPFSCCNPGCGIILKGYNLGTEPGVIRLIGNFTDMGNPSASKRNYLELEDIEWTPTSVGGTVPMITGVIDQLVQIQYVTKDGWKSETIPCGFTATREVRRLGRNSRAIRRKYCHVGDNHKIGDKGGDYSYCPYLICCSVKTDHNIGYEGNSGTDVVDTRELINGWAFHSLYFNDVTSNLSPEGGGTIHSVKGFKEGHTRLEIRVRWETERVGRIYYMLDLDIIGPKGVPFVN